MVREGLERMKVYKTLSYWRKEYSVFYNRDADNASCASFAAF